MSRSVDWIGRVLAAMLVALAALFVLFVSDVGRYRQLAAENSHAPAPVVDAIVVLTGGRDRIDEGVRVFAQGKARRMLISGVHEAATRAEVFRHFPMVPLLFECCTDLGYKAKDTIGNAAETRDWAATWGFRSILVITSAPHMPRSLVELAREMPDVEVVPYPVAIHFAQRPAWWANRYTALTLASEYVKYLNALARLGWARLGGVQTPAARDQVSRAAASMVKGTP